MDHVDTLLFILEILPKLMLCEYFCAIFFHILLFFSHRWNYWLAGGLHPCGFHVVNIILHGVVSVILLWVASVCFCGQLSEFGAPRASLLCALLFAVHPIHTESVSTKLINFYVFWNVFMTDLKGKYIV